VWRTKIKDSKSDVQRRAEELLKYCEAESIIITGHSRFFRHIIRTYICPEYVLAEPEHCSAITTKKLPLRSCQVCRRLPIGLPGRQGRQCAHCHYLQRAPYVWNGGLLLVGLLVLAR
jgi:hypothetical protein